MSAKGKLTKVTANSFTIRFTTQPKDFAQRILTCDTTYTYSTSFIPSDLVTKVTCNGKVVTNFTTVEFINLYYVIGFERYQASGNFGFDRRRNVQHIVDGMLQGRSQLLTYKCQDQIEKAFGKKYVKIFDSYKGKENDAPKEKITKKGKKVVINES